MLRFEVSEAGQEALPAIDVETDSVVIGSGTSATIRLPAPAARDVHVRIERDRWIAIGDVGVRDAGADATATRRAGDSGTIGAGVTFDVGGYRVRVAPAPAGSIASSPLRTDSIARELVRSLLGAGGAAAFEVERGPSPGTRRVLPPPEATIVIGRGAEATWVILDEDLSRAHAEVHRGWDGVSIRDLDSKNGTRLDGVVLTGRAPIRDGMRVELGKIALRFHDPAERHLRGDMETGTTSATITRVDAATTPSSPATRRGSPWPFALAATIASLAVAGLVWILAS